MLLLVAPPAPVDPPLEVVVEFAVVVVAEVVVVPVVVDELGSEPASSASSPPHATIAVTDSAATETQAGAVFLNFVRILMACSQMSG